MGPGITDLLLNLTAWLWFALEVGLFVRDRARGTGSTTHDRGTRILNVVTIIGAVALARILPVVLGGDAPIWLPGSGHGRWPVIAGLVIMWLGLLLRVWAIAVLGRAFRTTVEVDAGQRLVDRAPYRWVRHPSYTGLLLISTGFGLAQRNWVSLAVAVLAPMAVLVWRIHVEEQVLTASLGPVYTAYRDRTKRLVPGIW